LSRGTGDPLCLDSLVGQSRADGKLGDALQALREGIAHASPETAPELLAQAYDNLSLLSKRSGDNRGQERRFTTPWPWARIASDEA